MPTNSEPETAKIYVFPTRTAGSAGNRLLNGKPVTGHKSLPVVETDFGSAWYHDAAIQGEPRKR